MNHNIDALVEMILDPEYCEVLAQAARLAHGRPPASEATRIREQLADIAPQAAQ